MVEVGNRGGWPGIRNSKLHYLTRGKIRRKGVKRAKEEAASRSCFLATGGSADENRIFAGRKTIRKSEKGQKKGQDGSGDGSAHTNWDLSTTKKRKVHSPIT